MKTTPTHPPIPPPIGPNGSKHASVEEAAKYVGCGPKKIRGWVKTGVLPRCDAIQGKLLIPWGALYTI